MKIGIVGCGKQAPKHISGLRQFPEVEIVLADKDPEFARALGEKESLAWCDSVETLLADPEIGVLDICTPTPTHFTLASAAMEAGKDFLCEKPLCETVEQAKRLAALSQESGRIGMVGYIYRFAPIFETGHDLIHGRQALGRPTAALVRIGGRGSHQVWKHRKATGGGAMSEMLVHMLDLAIWYFGSVKQADLLTERLLRPQRVIQGESVEVDAEDYVVARFVMEDDTELLIQADMVTPAFNQMIEVQGENGTFMGSIVPEMPAYLFCSQPVGGYEAGRHALSAPPANLFLGMMEHFLAAVRERTQPSKGSIADSVKLLQAMEMLRGGCA